MPSACQKSLAEFAAAAAKRSKSFSAGACTWQKILLRLQVWNLFAIGEQIMRAADCKNLAESPEGDFRHVKTPCVSLLRSEEKNEDKSKVQNLRSRVDQNKRKEHVLL